MKLVKDGKAMGVYSAGNSGAMMASGIFKLGRFIRILPHPVMLGFVNGLAIVIGLAQFGQFKTNHRVVYEKADGHGGGGFQVAGDWFGWGSSELWIMIGT